MRRVATRAKVSPMTIYHHFQDRDGLIKALGEVVYADVAIPSDGTARVRLRSLLNAYRAKVLSYPGLTLAIFSRPSVFPDHARRITDGVLDLLQSAGMERARAQIWMRILVDYTHGEALALALVRRHVDEEDHDRALAELLDHAFGPATEQPKAQGDGGPHSGSAIR